MVFVSKLSYLTKLSIIWRKSEFFWKILVQKSPENDPKSVKNGLFEPKRSHFAPPGFPSLFIWGSYGYFAFFGILKQFYGQAANKKFSMAPEHACSLICRWPNSGHLEAAAINFFSSLKQLKFGSSGQVRHRTLDAESVVNKINLNSWCICQNLLSFLVIFFSEICR